MSNLILLVACFLFGMALRRGGRMPENAPSALNSFIIYISLPALVLLYVHEIRFTRDLAIAAAMPWLLFAMGAGFFWVAGRVLKLPRATVGALMITGGLGNTSFIGLPMIETFYGHEGIATGIIADQLGTFLALSTVGIIIAGVYSSGTPDVRTIARKIVLFPPFIALAVAALLIPVDYPFWFSTVLKRLGDTLAPLALVSVGFELRLGQLAGNGRNLALGLMFKLFLAPLLLYFLLVAALGGHGLVTQVTLFEAAMGPMITGAIVAIEHDLDPPLVSLMVAVGIALSFFTLPAWWWVLRSV